jgi:predicted nucleotidyltransferase
MNRPTQCRLQLAQRLAPTFCSLPGVAAVAVSGSTARGLADDWSDLELAVYWQVPPTLELRQSAVEALGAELTRRFTRDDPTTWFGVDNLRVQGFGVDVVMNTVPSVQEAVARAQTSTDLAEHTLGAMLAELTPLHGHAHIDGWKAALAYPPALRGAMLERHLRLFPHAGVRLAVARGDGLRVAERLVQWHKALSVALFALNTTWFPGHKAASRRLGGLALLPASAEERLARPWTGHIHEAVDDSIALVREVLALAAPRADLEAQTSQFEIGGRERWTPERLGRLEV